VWLSFSRHSPNWRVDQHFHSPRQKTTGQKYRKRQQKGKKSLARMASGFVFLLANPEFYSQLASWRVVIFTPANPCASHWFVVINCGGGLSMTHYWLLVSATSRVPLWTLQSGRWAKTAWFRMVLMAEGNNQHPVTWPHVDLFVSNERVHKLYHPIVPANDCKQLDSGVLSEGSRITVEVNGDERLMGGRWW
jgi:hypothetical protein